MKDKWKFFVSSISLIVATIILVPTIAYSSPKAVRCIAGCHQYHTPGGDPYFYCEGPARWPGWNCDWEIEPEEECSDTWWGECGGEIEH